MLSQHLDHASAVLRSALRTNHEDTRTRAIESALRSLSNVRAEAETLTAIVDTCERGISQLLEDENLYPPPPEDDLVVIGPHGETWTLDELLAREG